MRYRLFAFLLLLFVPAGAHVGVNDVFFEGQAGPYPLYVTVRPPLVIPGVAEVSIRSSAADVSRIRITPMTLTGAGSKFPPTPDPTVRSNADKQFFEGSLWIMSTGMWQVRLLVDGARGAAALSVPVPATSQRVSEMDSTTGVILAVLAAILAIGVAGIAGAAVGEALVPPGEAVPAAVRRRALLARGLGLVTGAALVYGGWVWWGAEAASYRESIYKPLAMSATVDGSTLRLQLSHTGWYQKKTLDDLLPDHGYPMHLYLIRDPQQDIVYHLHPASSQPGRFTAPLPALPAGKYQLFADIVHQNGFPETLKTSIELPTVAGMALGPDDAGVTFTVPNQDKNIFSFKSGATVQLERANTPYRKGQAATLRFRVLDANGNPAANLKPYLGMAAHLAVVAKDLQVFAHIHPAGSISMPAYEIAQTNLLAMKSNVLISSHSMGMDNSIISPEFAFPFGFPQAGSYRLILQFRTLSGVETAVFEESVLP